jgi:hypothetical protein
MVVPILKALKRQGFGLAPLTDFTVPMQIAFVAFGGWDAAGAKILVIRRDG